MNEMIFYKDFDFSEERPLICNMLDISISRHSPMWKGKPCTHKRFLNPLGRSIFQNTFNPHIVTQSYFQVNVCFTSDDAVAQLNKDYRDRHGSTNILSFHQFDTFEDIEREAAQDLMIHLGDLVLSDHTVFSEAHLFKRSLQNHVAHLFVHGMLHLLGYDHQEDEGARRMEALEIAILEKKGIPDPYFIS